MRPRASLRISCVSMRRTAARHIRNTPVTFTAMTRFHSSRLVSVSFLPERTTASLTTMSSRLRGAAARRTASSTSASFDTSPWKNGTSRTWCVGSPPSTTCSVMSISSSSAPSSWNFFAMARPMPEEAPVIEGGLADEPFHFCLMIMSRSSFATQRANGQSRTKKMIAAAVSGVGIVGLLLRHAAPSAAARAGRRGRRSRWS